MMCRISFLSAVTSASRVAGTADLLCATASEISSRRITSEATPNGAAASTAAMRRTIGPASARRRWITSSMAPENGKWAPYSA